ncbi:hypothetical protein AAG906_011251 [Vitis piasezkii]
MEKVQPLDLLETLVRTTGGMKEKTDGEESSPCVAMPLRAVRGNKTKTPGPGAQSTLRAPCSFWNEDVAVTPFPTHSSLFSFTCRHPQTFSQTFS